MVKMRPTPTPITINPRGWSKLSIAFLALLLVLTYLSVLQIELLDCTSVHTGHGDVRSPTNLLLDKHHRTSSKTTNKNKRRRKRYPVFNPWTDFTYTSLDVASTSTANNNSTSSFSSSSSSVSVSSSSHAYYSSHTCVAAAPFDRRPDAVSRTCHYRNLYFHIPTKKFHYWPHPSEQLMLQSKTDSERIQREMETTIGHVRDSYEGKSVELHSTPWKPIIHYKDMGAGVGGSATGAADQVMPSGSRVRKLEIHDGRIPVLAFYHGSLPNYGHLIWDDFLSIYLQLDFMDLVNPNPSNGKNDDVDDYYDNLFPIPFVMEPTGYFGAAFCYPASEYTWPKCTKFYKRLYPSIWHVSTDPCTGDPIRSGNWLQGPASIGGAWKQKYNSDTTMCPERKSMLQQCYNNTLPPPPTTTTANTEYILVPHVTVGSGRLAHFSCFGECTLGRAPQLYRFRNYLMDRILNFGTENESEDDNDIINVYNSETNPITGYITFSLAFGATRGKGEVTFFDDEIKMARERYGDDAVRAVDFSNMTLVEQAKVIGNSAALFTNHGGGSASTVFLPKGASAFLYWRGQQRDIEFYRNVAYFRTQWVEYHERKNVKRTMQLLEMELMKTKIHYPNMICFKKLKS